MARIGFIGLGNMGAPMARNLLKAGHEVVGFDLVAAALQAHQAAGGQVAEDARSAAREAAIVITMLPSGKHVHEVIFDHVLAAAGPGTLLIDCSTIDVDTARAVNKAAGQAGYEMLDAPVSGGVGGAEAATLAFMVGGSDAAAEKALPVLQAMGKTIVHVGPAGSGQATKLCNNMITAISMIAVSEAFTLGKNLGLDPQKLFDVVSKSSGQCWSVTTYCPVPGPVPTSPANNDYKAGFAAGLMLKDLTLAQDAAAGTGTATPLGAHATELYGRFVEASQATTDFSGIIRMLRDMPRTEGKLQ